MCGVSSRVSVLLEHLRCGVSILLSDTLRVVRTRYDRASPTYVFWNPDKQHICGLESSDSDLCVKDGFGDQPLSRLSYSRISFVRVSQRVSQKVRSESHSQKVSQKVSPQAIQSPSHVCTK